MSVSCAPGGGQWPPFLLAVLLVGCFAVVGLWDAVAAFSGGSIQSVSAILYQWGHDWPILTLLVGLLIGHLFWPVRN